MENKWGLVFSGGGAKGAYEIGVWRALRELGFEKNITAVSGASVGSLNAVLFAEGDYEKAEKIWNSITPVEFLDCDIRELMAQSFPNAEDVRELFENVKQGGICSRNGLLNIIRYQANLSAVSKSQCRIYANAVYEHRGSNQVEYFCLNGKTAEEITEILLASSAMPFVYEPVSINGILYRDGGIVDNTPVYPLVRDHYQRLIVVKLDQKGYVEKNFYKNREIIEIIPSTDLGDFFEGTVDFSHKNIVKRVELGYYDALLTLRQYRKQKEQEKESQKAGVTGRNSVHTQVYTTGNSISDESIADLVSQQAVYKSNADFLQKEIQRKMDYFRELEENADRVLESK